MARPKTNRPLKTELTLSVLEDNKEKLRRIAEAEGVSISELVERYAESYILEVEEEANPVEIEIDPNQGTLFEPWTPPPPPEFPELASMQEIFYSTVTIT